MSLFWSQKRGKSLTMRLRINLIGLLFLFSISVCAQQTFEEQQISSFEKEYMVLFETTSKLYSEKKFTLNNRETDTAATKILLDVTRFRKMSKDLFWMYMASHSGAKDHHRRISLLIVGSRSLENSLDAAIKYIYYGQNLFIDIKDDEFLIAEKVYSSIKMSN